MQCLQYVFYSFSQFKNHMVYVMGYHANNPQNYMTRPDRASGSEFEIPGSATATR